MPHKKGHSDKSGGMSWMEALKAWNKKQGGKYQKKEVVDIMKLRR